MKIKEGGRNWLWGVVFLIGTLGYHIKVQAIIILIAITMCAFFELRKKNVKEVILVVAFCVAGMSIGQCIYHAAYSCFTDKIPIYEDAQFSWQHFMMMGLNEKNNGIYNGDDVDFSRSFATREEREQAQSEEIKERLREYGVDGYLSFIKTKAAMCYTDGTFWWSRSLGDFYSEIYEEKNQLISPFLRSIYYFDGNNYSIYATVVQVLWMSILVLCFGSGIGSNRENLFTVLRLTFIGIFIFEMLFEVAGRHLICNIPIFVILALVGADNLYKKIPDMIFDKRGNRMRIRETDVIEK